MAAFKNVTEKTLRNRKRQAHLSCLLPVFLKHIEDPNAYKPCGLRTEAVHHAVEALVKGMEKTTDKRLRSGLMRQIVVRHRQLTADARPVNLEIPKLRFALFDPGYSRLSVFPEITRLDQVKGNLADIMCRLSLSKNAAVADAMKGNLRDLTAANEPDAIDRSTGSVSQPGFAA